jgi:TonB family protein
MALQSLLLCPEEKTARVLSRVLSELEIGMEQCTEPFDAVKKLMRQRYDAVIVDWENEANATLVLKNARMSPSNKTSLAVAIVEGQTSVRNAFRAGANFVLYKPISLEQAKTSLRAARALMQRGAEAAAKGQGGEGAQGGPTLVPPQNFPGATSFQSSQPSSPSSRMAPVTPISTPSPSVAAPTMSATESSWGQAGAAAAPAKETQSPIEELRNLAGNVLDKFQGPRVSSPKATTVVDARFSDTKIVKSFPGTTPKSDEDGDFYKLDLDADPSAPSKAKPAAKVTEARVLAKPQVESPRVSTPATAEKPNVTEPELASIAEPLGKRAISTFDEVRNRVAAQASRAVPSAFDAPAAEEGSGGFPKPVLLGVAAVVVVVGLVVAIIHFRSASSPQPVAQQEQSAPAQQQPAAVAMSTPTPTDVTVEPVPQVPPAKGEFKTGKEVLPKPSAGKAAPQSTAGTQQAEVKPGPLDESTGDSEPEVTVHKLAAPVKPKQQPEAEVAEAAPPSLAALGSTAGTDQMGGIVGTPVSVPKLVAPDRVRVSQGVSQGMLVQMVKPQYPAVARAMRLQGAVLLDALISKDGAVKNLKVVKGHPVLAKAALDAVKQWRYKPYLLNDQPVEVETQITVNFLP